MLGVGLAGSVLGSEHVVETSVASTQLDILEK